MNDTTIPKNTIRLSVPLALSTLVLMLLICVLGAIPQSAFADYQDGQGEIDERGRFAGSLMASDAFENPTWTLSAYSVTLREYNKPAVIYINGYHQSYYWDYPEVESSDENVVVVGDVERNGSVFSFTVEKMDIGDAEVTVYDYDGATRTIKVSCQPTPLRLTNLYGSNTQATSFTFSASTNSTSYLYIGCCYDSVAGSYKRDNTIVAAVSSNPSVATARRTDASTSGPPSGQVTPVRAGSAVVTVTDQYGQVATMSIVVEKGYFKPNLNYRTSAFMYYGDKTATIFSAPKAKVTLRIGKEKRTVTLGANGFKKIKLKHIYKLKKKYTVTVKTANAKIKKKLKVGSRTWTSTGTFYSCRYYVPITIHNANKGDVLTVSAGGEKYKRTVYYSSIGYTTTVYFRYQMRNYSSLTFKVKNKYGQTLENRTQRIYWR